MEAKVIGLPAANRALIGASVIDGKTETGEIGRMIEDIISGANYKIDRDGTVDLPELNVEVKSRKSKSKCPHTMGTMTVENILKTPYEQSPIYKKVQRQYRVKHDELTVNEAEVFDFSDPYIQGKLKDAYNHGKTLMAAGKFDKLGSGKATSWAYWEKKSGNSYAYRIRDDAMRGMENAKYSTYKKHFE
jgi:hypothetical protein